VTKRLSQEASDERDRAERRELLFCKGGEYVDEVRRRTFAALGIPFQVLSVQEYTDEDEAPRFEVGILFQDELLGEQTGTILFGVFGVGGNALKRTEVCRAIRKTLGRGPYSRPIRLGGDSGNWLEPAE
jgi:hypothetical protein